MPTLHDIAAEHAQRVRPLHIDTSGPERLGPFLRELREPLAHIGVQTILSVARPGDLEYLTRELVRTINNDRGRGEFPERDHALIESRMHGCPVLLDVDLPSATVCAVCINGSWASDPLVWVDAETADKWTDDIDAAIAEMRGYRHG